MLPVMQKPAPIGLDKIGCSLYHRIDYRLHICSRNERNRASVDNSEIARPINNEVLSSTTPPRSFGNMAHVLLGYHIEMLKFRIYSLAVSKSVKSEDPFVAHSLSAATAMVPTSRSSRNIAYSVQKYPCQAGESDTLGL